MQKISIASYSFHTLLENKMIDVYGYLESCRYRYGLSTADIWNGFLMDFEVEDFKKLRKALDERELTLENLCCDWCHPYDEDPDKLAEQHALADKMLLAAEILGAKTVRMDLGIRPREVTDEQMEYVAKKFREYAKRGQEVGFKIGPENHWGASRRKCVQKQIREMVNEPNFGQLLHLGNWDLDEGETKEGNDMEMAKWAIHSHVTRPILPQANRIIPEFLAAGYKGTLSVEMGDGRDAEYTFTGLAVATVRHALALMKE